ncbi:MAG TPA: GAF domain-containing protein [Spirochaetota bacterium]|nr:GAF domain-containing protein [Spirochaetota bacterium]HPS86794.1 GAF domain-containing protein [Spirochaetota bacterium]
MNETQNPNKIELLERQVENLSKLVEINGIINSTLNINRLLSIIMEMVKDIMDTETSTLLLYDEEKDELVFKVALGEAGDELKEKYRVKMGQGIAGWVALNRKDLQVNDVYNDPRFDPMYDKNTGFTTKSILCAPLLFKGKLLGVIQAINPVNKNGFDVNDMNLFRVFSNQAALAVQNAIFFQKAIEEERLAGELQSAKIVQESLTPFIDFVSDGFDAAARSLSAREVGGAFHFFREYEKGVYLLTLGNLNTKGIPGAMRASTLAGLIRAMYELNIRKSEVIIDMINRHCLEEIECSDGFSLFISIIDINNMTIEFVNSGDAYPIMIREGKAAYLRFLKRSSGYLGSRNFIAGKIELNLLHGDNFIVFSSSLPELRSTDGRHLGLSGIINFIEKRTGTLGGIIDSLLNYAYNYTGGVERRKDISVVSFTIK